MDNEYSELKGENLMKYHLATAAFLLAALGCYVAGASAGVVALAAAGLIFESVFWFRLFKRSRAMAHRS